MTEQNLPATATPVPAQPLEEPEDEPRRPLRVALLPLALVSLVILGFVVAAWTFLAAT